jgi:hypothetical protein
LNRISQDVWQATLARSIRTNVQKVAHHALNINFRDNFDKIGLEKSFRGQWGGELRIPRNKLEDGYKESHYCKQIIIRREVPTKLAFNFQF